MPVLSNSRHEKFAIAVVCGKSHTAAYIAAGYGAKGARQNAHRLITNDDIRGRILELKRKLANENKVQLGEIIYDLDQTHKMAMALGQCSAAISAIMNKAKLLGIGRE